MWSAKKAGSSAPDRLRRPSPPLKLAIAGALSQGAAVGIGRFVYTPILPAMMSALHLSQSQVGLIATANFAGYLVGALVAAAPVFGRAPRLWLTIALLVSAATTAAMGLASSLPAFLVLRAVGGLASAFVLVFASTVVLQRLARDGRGGLSAVHFAGVGAAIVVSALATSWMASSGMDWRAMWLVSGALSLLAILAALRLLPPDEAAPLAATAPGAAPIRKGAASLMLAYGLFGFGYVVTATFIVAIVRTYPAAAPMQPYVWLLVGLSAIPSVALWTLIGERIGVRRAFALACLVEALGVAVSVLRPTADGAVIASLLLGGTYMGITALGLVAARGLEPANPSRVLGRMTAAFALGQMIGPAFAGWLAERLGGFGLASLIASAALVVSAALTFRPARDAPL
jgi:predicted MFS family arabinose efflux permease